MALAVLLPSFSAPAEGAKDTASAGEVKSFVVEQEPLPELSDGYTTEVLARSMPVKSTFEGVASWYGPGFDGRPMANGEIYDQNEILVAHRSLPFGTMLRITNLINGKVIVAPVKDRGPYIEVDGVYTRDIDLSYATAKAIDMVAYGLVPVRVEILGE